MTRVYALANQKGGVGKTTTTINLAAYLGIAGKTVLIVDMDPQSNATSSLGFDKRSGQPSIYDSLVAGRPIDEVIVPTANERVSLLPSAIQLAGAEIELVGILAREGRLARTLSTVLDRYDYVLIDSPPSLGLLTINSLTAANGVLIPVQCEYLALEGLGQLVSTIELIRDSLNPRLRVAGVIMTMFDSRTNLSQGVVEEVRAHFPSLTFETIIPRNVRLGEAPSFGQAISTYDPTSRGAAAYQRLAAELLRRDGSQPVNC
ncbi:MAG: ParA family protein [Chloroflexota bacterium]|nr:MAG: ParA family protein [Chloroflexota bacterium]